MNITHTEIVMLLDRSGSMSSIADDMAGGFNAFMDEQRESNPNANVSLYQFDHGFQEVYVAKPLPDVGPLQLVPRGTTALLDAIARAVAETRSRLEAKPVSERPRTVVFGIITDGMENSSTEFTQAAVKHLIERQEEIDEWTFIYLGANQDAIKVGHGLGISRERSMTYAPKQADAAMRGMSASVNALRLATDEGLDIHAVRAAAAFSEASRDSAMNGSDGHDLTPGPHNVHDHRPEPNGTGMIDILPTVTGTLNTGRSRQRQSKRAQRQAAMRSTDSQP
ncbi:VWA domain-containing protein [Cellulosimicrobium funkei]|nr:VWA domain-containing protein [Cellulosimicrobium funkei]